MSEHSEVTPTASETEAAHTAGDASDFDVASAIEAIRHRPGMYVGGIDGHGLHTLFREVLNYALAEVVAGECTEITVVYNTDQSVSLTDNGRGLMVETHAASGKFIADLVFTELWPLRYFVKMPDWCAVGVASVNALSAWLACETRHDGKIYRQRFTRGIPDAPLTVVGTCAENDTGTKVTWLADAAVFTQALRGDGSLNYEPERFRSRLRELAYLNPGVAFTFHNAHDKRKPETYRCPRGIAEYISDVNRGKNPIHPEAIVVRGESDGVQFNLAFQYNRNDETFIHSYVNTCETRLGGTHVDGFKRALRRSLNRYARQNELLQTFSQAEFEEGLTAVVSIHLTDPMFPGATKERLGTPEVTGIVSRITGKQLSSYFQQHPDVAQAILEKAAGARARVTVQKNKWQ